MHPVPGWLVLPDADNVDCDALYCGGQLLSGWGHRSGDVRCVRGRDLCFFCVRCYEQYALCPVCNWHLQHWSSCECMHELCGWNIQHEFRCKFVCTMYELHSGDVQHGVRGHRLIRPYNLWHRNLFSQYRLQCLCLVSFWLFVLDNSGFGVLCRALLS